MGFAANGGGFNNPCQFHLIASGTIEWMNNFLPYASTTGSGCTTEMISGNINTVGAVSYIANTYKITPGTALAKAAHDGTNIGVNEGMLPLIRNLRTTVSDKTALLEFDLSGPIQDAGNTQPCALEVSTNENLKSYLGAYTVVNDLNPAMFKQPDGSNRTNAKLLGVQVSNGHVAWPIGQNATITDDAGAPRSLALTPSTLHYGRLQCYGDTQAFTFTTAAAASSTSAITRQYAPPAGVASVRVDYGATPAMGSNVAGSVNGGHRFRQRSRHGWAAPVFPHHIPRFRISNGLARANRNPTCLSVAGRGQSRVPQA